MTTTRVLLLEAAGPESAALVETALARGYQVHAATGPGQFPTYSTELRTAPRLSANRLLAARANGR